VDDDVLVVADAEIDCTQQSLSFGRQNGNLLLVVEATREKKVREYQERFVPTY
jgi:hypothetical protein